MGGQCRGENVIQVIHRGAQADGLGDGGRAGLELPGNLVPFGPLAADTDDHAAAGHERRHGLEELSLRVEDADPRRAAHLVAGEGHEISPQPVHVQAVMGQALRGVDQHPGPASGPAR